MRILFFSFLMLIVGNSYAQNEKITIKTSILDTIEKGRNHVVKRVFWLNDTLEINQLNSTIVIDTAKQKRAVARMDELAENSGYSYKRTNLSEHLKGLKELLKDSGQNCYCYALEKCFENSPFQQDIFNASTLISADVLNKVLSHYFDKIEEFTTRPKRNLKQQLPNDIVLAFVNKSGWVTHAVYHKNNVFYTKNGMQKPSTFQSLKDFLKKSYYDTKEIILYRLNTDKVRYFYTHNKK